MQETVLPLTIELNYPVEHDGRTYERLEIAREPLVGDLAGIPTVRRRWTRESS